VVREFASWARLYSIKTTPKVIGLIVRGLGFRDRVRDRVINRD